MNREVAVRITQSIIEGSLDVRKGSLAEQIVDATQPTEPARVAPSREQVYVVVRQSNCGDAYDSKERANETTDNLLALFAAQPTVEQVKAEALREAADAAYAARVDSLLPGIIGIAWLRSRADRLVGCGSDAEWEQR